MNENLNLLVDLQKTDLEIVAVEKRLEELHTELHGAETMLATAQKGVEAAHRVTQEAQAHVHSREVDLAGNEGQIKKLTLALNTASNNKEYQVILLKTGTIRAENDKIELDILMEMDAVEEKEREEEAARAVQREAEAGLRAAEGQLETMRKELEEQLVGMRSSRGEVAERVDDKSLTLYERIRGGNRKSGTAVVELHGEYCQGCQMAVRPQDIADLMNGVGLVLCRSCQRILVLVL